MVCHPNCPGIQAAIIVNNRPVEEWDDPALTDESTISKYIIAYPYTRFGVRLSIDEDFGGFGIYVKIEMDGAIMGTKSIPNPPDEDMSYGEVVNGITFKIDGSPKQHCFAFGQQKPYDDKEISSQQALKRYIKISFYRILNPPDEATPREPHLEVDRCGPVVDFVRNSSPFLANMEAFVRYHRGVDHEEQPLTTFILKYRRSTSEMNPDHPRVELWPWVPRQPLTWRKLQILKNGDRLLKWLADKDNSPERQERWDPPLSPPSPGYQALFMKHLEECELV